MKVPRWLVPALVVVSAFAGIGIAKLFAIPTVTLELAPDCMPPRQSRVLSLTVRGVRCADTAQAAATNLKDLRGVYLFVAYASRGRVDITIDPELITRESVIEAIEGPIFDAESGEFRFSVFDVIDN